MHLSPTSKLGYLSFKVGYNDSHMRNEQYITYGQ